MKILYLTVQSNGKGGYRLGINKKNLKNIFKCRGKFVSIELNSSKTVKCRTACGNPCDKIGNWILINSKSNKPYRKKGYDLNNKELSEWIKTNRFYNYDNGKPTKLKFTLIIMKDELHLKFVGKQTNL